MSIKTFRATLSLTFIGCIPPIGNATGALSEYARNEGEKHPISLLLSIQQCGISEYAVNASEKHPIRLLASIY